jgi:hypothetical protein
VPKKYTAVRKEVAGGLRNMHNDKFWNLYASQILSGWSEEEGWHGQGM